MIFEVQLKINGKIKTSNDVLEVKKHPYNIRVFKKEEDYFISVSKPISSGSTCLPKVIITNEKRDILLPEESSYSDMIEIINHIESFGALDNKLEFIDKTNIILKWISESDNDHFSPLKEIKREVIKYQELETITEKWLLNAIIDKNQLGDLFIPFSFYRDGKNLFFSLRYQSAFCTFYMMLEYFFHEKSWGIENDAYKRIKCLNESLSKTLKVIKEHQNNHYNWLNNELNRRNKEYNEEGLLFVINMFRNELSHAADKNKHRNLFTEHKYFSLSYIMMTLCVFVSIKKRLLPYVHPSEIDKFLEK